MYILGIDTSCDDTCIAVGRFEIRNSTTAHFQWAGSPSPYSRAVAKSEKLLNHPSELELIKQLIQFPEIIEDTAKDYQAQRLPQYAIDLATIFHQFYRDCRVISEDKLLTRARLGLILATKALLKNTLNLMGISAPKKM